MAKRYHSSKNDSGMIHNDTSKFANLPTEVIMEPYAVMSGQCDMTMQDNISGIDKQMSADNAALNRGKSPHKI